MSDLHLGQTMTEAFSCVSFGTAHTFKLDFPYNKVVFNNLTAWASETPGLAVRSTFFLTAYNAGFGAGFAFQEYLMDDATPSIFSFDVVSSDGFTVANLPGGAPAYRAAITAISQALPCVVTISAPPLYPFQTGQIVRITDLGDQMPVERGMSQLDGKRFLIHVLSSTTFALYDPVSDEPIDSTSYETYVTGGSIDVESRVISLNNPQQYPYNFPNAPYVPNPFVYNPVTYELTAGTAVMGSRGDVFLIEVYKWGQYTNLGPFSA